MVIYSMMTIVRFWFWRQWEEGNIVEINKSYQLELKGNPMFLKNHFLWQTTSFQNQSTELTIHLLKFATKLQFLSNLMIANQYILSNQNFITDILDSYWEWTWLMLGMEMVILAYERNEESDKVRSFALSIDNSHIHGSRRWSISQKEWEAVHMIYNALSRD